MAQGLSVDKILQMAASKEFYVHRYMWTKANLRKKCRKLEREGKLVLVGVYGDTLAYRTKRGKPEWV